MSIAYSRGRDKFDAHPEQRSAADFDAFESAVLSDRSTAKGQTFVCAPMRINGDGRAHRGKDHALPRAFLPFDFDCIPDEQTFNDLRLWFSDYRGFGYTTASHRPDAPRCRVVLELDRLADREEGKRIGLAMQKRIERAFGADVLKIDGSVYRAEQPLYTPLRGAIDFRFIGGDVVNVDDLLAEVPPDEAREGAASSGTSEDWLAALLDGDDIHGNACRLVGRMVAKGMDSATIKAWFAGVAQRVANERGIDRARELMGGELDRMIAGARSKGYDKPKRDEQAADGLDPENMVELVRADTIAMTPIRWLWDGYLARGKMHILAGAPGGGKTTIALALAATLTSGGRWPDGTVATVDNVLIWSGEDDPADTLVPRLRAMEADLTRVAFVENAVEIDEKTGVPKRVAFDPAKHMLNLMTRISDAPPALLIIDPIVSAVSGDSHKNAETRRGLQPLVDLARRLGVAVLGITHFSKGTQGREPTERVTGSLAFGALARIVFVASKTQDAGRVFMKAKANIASDEGGFGYDVEQVQVPGFPDIVASRILWGGAVEGNARDVLAEAEAEVETVEDDGRTETDEAIDALRDVLTPGEMLAKEAIATMKSAGFTDKVIRMARERIGIKVRRSGFGKDMKWLWSLPSGADFAHRCPDDPLMPCPPNSEARASMDSEGIRESDEPHFESEAL